MPIDITLQQRSLLAICVGLAIATLFTFFFCLWQWQSDWVLAHQPDKPSLVSKKNDTAMLIDSIPKAHLFGKSLEGDMPVSSLQLKVTGIVKTHDEEGGATSKAYISIGGETSKIYQVGDSLPDGVKIYAITPDTVILDHDGEFEKLPLPREKLEFKPRNTEGEQ